MALIISGITLIIFQLIADVGNSNASSLNLIGFIAYCSVGIIGLIMLTIGLLPKTKLKATIILHQTYKKRYNVLSYIFAILVGIICFGYMNLLFDEFSQYYLFLTISSLYLLIYLLFYRGKKPSSLFPIAMLFFGLSNIYGVLGWLPIVIIQSPSKDLFAHAIFRILFMFSSSVIYIILSIMIYKEKFAISRIKILGRIAFVLMVIFIFRALIIDLWLHFNIEEIILPLTIFLYTCVVPINNTPTTEEQSITLKGGNNS